MGSGHHCSPHSSGYPCVGVLVWSLFCRTSQFVFICLTERSSAYLSHFCWHVCICGCIWEGTSLPFSLYFQSSRSFHYRSVFIISVQESCSAYIREIPPAKWHGILMQKLYMCILKPIQVETKNNLSFEISQDWFFPNVHWTLFCNVADFNSDTYPLSMTHHMWQVWEEGGLLYVRFAHGSGENLETQPGWLAEDNIWAGS